MVFLKSSSFLQTLKKAESEKVEQSAEVVRRLALFETGGDVMLAFELTTENFVGLMIQSQRDSAKTLEEKAEQRREIEALKAEVKLVTDRNIALQKERDDAIATARKELSVPSMN